MVVRAIPVTWWMRMGVRPAAWAWRTSRSRSSSLARHRASATSASSAFMERTIHAASAEICFPLPLACSIRYM